MTRYSSPSSRQRSLFLLDAASARPDPLPRNKYRSKIEVTPFVVAATVLMLVGILTAGLIG